MKSSTISNLKKYAALTAGSAALVSTSEAAIVYVDVNPDVSVHIDTFNIDLNGDNVNARLSHVSYISISVLRNLTVFSSAL